MRLWVVALVTTGCFSKPDQPQLGSDATAPIDAYIVTDCSGVATFVSQPVPVLDDPRVNGDPAITANKLELFFPNTVTGPTSDIYRATRSLPTATFTIDPIALPWGNANEFDPAPNGDGTIVAFVSQTPGGKFGYLATATANAAVGPAGGWNVAPIPGITDTVASIDLSPDAKTVYWATDTGDLMAADLVGSTYVPRGAALATGISWPAVSADGKELFYANGADTFRATRTSTSVAFSTPGTMVPVTGHDPDLSADGQMLVTYTPTAVYQSTRVCPSAP